MQEARREAGASDPCRDRGVSDLQRRCIIHEELYSLIHPSFFLYTQNELKGEAASTNIYKFLFPIVSTVPFFFLLPSHLQLLISSPHPDPPSSSPHHLCFGFFFERAWLVLMSCFCFCDFQQPFCPRHPSVYCSLRHLSDIFLFPFFPL